MLSPFSPYSTKCFYNFGTFDASKDQTQKTQNFSPKFNFIKNPKTPTTPTTPTFSPSRSLFNLILKPQIPKSLSNPQTLITEKLDDSVNTGNKLKISRQNLTKSNNNQYVLFNKDFMYSGIENDYGEKVYYKKDVQVARVNRGIYIEGGNKEHEINKEIKYIQELSKECDNIVQYYGYVTSGHYIYTITTWANFKLKDLLLSDKEKLDWSQKVSIARGIANALQHCHRKGKLHYDLSSENILLTDNLEPMLYNFRIPEGLSSTDCLTRWSSPEAWKYKIHKPSSEVYSFSTILWEISAETLPFDSVPDDLLYKTVNKRPKPESIAGTPIIYRDLMIKGWAQKPDDRPTMEEAFKILKILESDFKNGRVIKRVTETSSSFANYLDMTFEKSVTETSSFTDDLDIFELESNLSSNDDSTIFIPDFTTNSLNREKSDMTPSRASSICSVSTISLLQDHIFSTATSTQKTYTRPETTTSAEPIIEPPTKSLHKLSPLNEMPSSILDDAISLHNKRKYQKAFKLFKAYYKRDKNPIANYWIGLYYYKGFDGVKQNFKNSVKYLSEAAEQGHSDAQFLYAKLLFSGYSSERHKDNRINIGAEILKKAVNAGNLEAMIYYGKLQIKGGYTIKKNIDAGRELINRVNEIRISTCSNNNNNYNNLSYVSVKNMKNNNASTLENSTITNQTKTGALGVPYKPVNIASRRSSNLSFTIDIEKSRPTTYYY